ncbi:Regulator of microtubule dynamics protein 1 [Orchesella cincta]|uniref:Regulator of microtubule dynamics protein 1 n=1 Tax=Orchesella cincta TaxID=48709 RepID=A0A1D2N861_ORCCI|nr:Regulator of microtubule dynamics protein 1 [Orchesella cincta]
MESQQQPGCHVTWITEMAPHIPVPEMRTELFSRAIETISDRLKELEGRIILGSKTMNTRLMAAAFCAHLSKFSEALDWLTEATKCVEEITFRRDQHGQAYRYLIGANFSCIANMMRSQSELNVPEASPTVKGFINSKYDVENNVFQAVISVSKGILAHQMRFEDSKIYLRHLKRATVLDPQTAEWPLVLYKRLRKLRRKKEPGSTPSQEEKDAITKAYHLDPDYCIVQTHYATMLDEKFKCHHYRGYVPAELRESTGSEIIDLMEKAIERNPEDRWAHVRLAEIYGYGDYPHLDKKQGEILFQECEKRWPDSSMVMHKFGIYYKKNHNWKKALDYFKRGLDMDLDNFPCLMDYLKCVSKNPKREDQNYDLMLRTIDRCLPSSKFKKFQLTKLLLAKGLLLWLGDTDGTKKRQACDLWVEAVVNNSDSGHATIVDAIKKGFLDVVGKVTVDLKELSGILSQELRLLAPGDGNCVQKKAVIEDLINEFQSHGSRTVFRESAPGPSRMPLGFGRNSQFSIQTSSTSYSSVSAARPERRPSSPKSLADSDDNWRR